LEKLNFGLNFSKIFSSKKKSSVLPPRKTSSQRFRELANSFYMSQESTDYYDSTFADDLTRLVEFASPEPQTPLRIEKLVSLKKFFWGLKFFFKNRGGDH